MGFLAAKIKPNRPTEPQMIEKKLRINESGVRFAAKGSPQSKNKSNKNGFGDRWSHTLDAWRPGEFSIEADSEEDKC